MTKKKQNKKVNVHWYDVRGFTDQQFGRRSNCSGRCNASHHAAQVPDDCRHFNGQFSLQRSTSWRVGKALKLKSFSFSPHTNTNNWQLSKKKQKKKLLFLYIIYYSLDCFSLSHNFVAVKCVSLSFFFITTWKLLEIIILHIFFY